MATRLRADAENSGTAHAEDTRTIRLLLAVHDPLARCGLRSLLTGVSHLRVLGEAANLENALAQARRTCPDVLLLDTQMSRPPDALQTVQENLPRVKVLLLANTANADDTIAALANGARGVLLKSAGEAELIAAVRTVGAGDYWIDSRRVTHLVQALRDLEENASHTERSGYGLTHREMEVVTCIVEGCSNKDIARQFAISIETVKRHLSNTFDKTGVSTRLELALFALTHRLVSPLRFAG